MHAKSMEKPSRIFQPPLNIKETIQGRDLMYTPNVGKPSSKSQNFLYTLANSERREISQIY